jgi:hypothetical protein
MISGTDKMNFIIWWGIVWIISGTIVAGFYFADIQGKFSMVVSARQALGEAILFGMLYGATGPIGIAAAWLLTGFAQHGWRLWSKHFRQDAR